MSKGFLIYAPDSSQKDVVDSAILSALSIKISQNKYNNVALLTNDKTNFVSEYFDEILEFPFNINQFNTEYTGIDNIWQVLHASPFDETIFCINDVLFFNDLQYELEYMSYFNLLFPQNTLALNCEFNTYMYMTKHIEECNLPNILCDVFYFKKTGKSIYEFFNMLEIVTKNWRDIYYKIMDSHRPKNPDIRTNMSVAMRLSCYDLLCNIYTDKLNYTKPEYGWTEQYNHFLDDKCNLIIQNHKVISPLVINDENFVTEDVLNTYKTIYEIKNESN
jgi:hypothetical protein|tara:strand:- start:1261 stop:2088 length:828 start_codon:yes stop_codon:yes gene_type:complete